MKDFKNFLFKRSAYKYAEKLRKKEYTAWVIPIPCLFFMSYRCYFIK